jgi:phospholipid/cholesterol/gamma-HCH transport system substrate-binding protein
VRGAMIKQTPSIGRIVAMVAFTLSVFAILIFLWLAFGGSVPLKPEGYRFTVHMPEAATLAEEADVRMAGVNVGKVKTKELDKGGARTIVEVQLDERYAPIPKDTRAILRQKTLLGETYLELAPGNKSSGLLDDGGRLPNAHVEKTTELDEIFTAFDPQTRQAFKDWVKELDGAITKGHRSEDLSDAFGNFEGFAVDGAKLLQVLDEQDLAVHRLIKNTGRVFGAINERQGALRELIVNSKRTFEATASRDEALAETFAIFPTFLDESKATMARLEDFSRSTHPLVNDLKGPADDLGPTVRDLGDLAPDLENLFRDLPPLIRAGRTGLPALENTLQEAEPLAEALHTFFPELNPILSMFNFQQTTIAAFITNGAADINADYGTGQRGQTQMGLIEDRSFEAFPYGSEPPDWVRGNAYLHPNSLMRALHLGTVESYDCPGGERKYPEDALEVGEQHSDKRAPCFVIPPSLYDGKMFAYPRKGVAPLRNNPKGFEGSRGPATDPDPGPND